MQQHNTIYLAMYSGLFWTNRSSVTVYVLNSLKLVQYLLGQEHGVLKEKCHEMSLKVTFFTALLLLLVVLSQLCLCIQHVVSLNE